MNTALMAQLARAVEGLHEPADVDGRRITAAEHRDEWTAGTRRGFVQEALLEGAPADCLGLWAQVGTHARLNDDERAWVGAEGAAVGPLAAALTAAVKQAGDTEPNVSALPALEGAWTRTTYVRSAGTSASGAQACLGHVVAAFASRDAADASREALRQLAVDLAFGLRFIRVVRERHAFLEAAGVLAGFEPKEALRRIAALAQHELRADGFKVYALRRLRAGVRVQTLLRTDRPDVEEPWALDAEIGIANWVLLNDDWFLGKIERDASGDPLLAGHVGGGQELRQRAMRERGDDPEDTMWFLPLRFDGRVLGVICPWRTTTDAFDPGADLPAAEQAGHLLRAACRALVDDEVERHALAVELDLDRQVDKARTPAEIYSAWAEAAAEVGGAAGSALFLRDAGPEGKDPPVYYCAARVHVPAPVLRPCTLRCDHEPDDRELREIIQAALREHAAEIDGLVPREPEILLQDGTPAGAFVLFDRAPGPLETRPTLDDDVRRDALRTFARRRDRRFLRQATDALARRALATFTRDPKDATLDEQRDALLAAGAALVKEYTGADHVRLFVREALEPSGFKLAAPMPPIPNPQRLPDGHGPLTQKALRDKASVHVLDLRDDAEPLRGLIAPERFRGVADALGWSGVQSWLCEPVIIGGRCVGMFKALTRVGGTLLGGAEEIIAQELARAVSAELSELRQAELPTRLNRLTTECARLTGTGLSELSKAIVKVVDEILTEFVAPQTRFLAVATLEPDTLSTLAASPGVDAVRLVDSLQLRLVSERDLVLANAAPARDLYPTGTDHWRGVAIEISGAPLRGALFVFTAGKATKDDDRVFRELAHALATLAESERRWHEWRREVGLFRHAFFSPAQGLASAAGAVLRQAEQNRLIPERMTYLRGLIAKETEALRLWRDNQRLYMSREVLPDRRRRGLKRFVERWVARFDAAARRKSARVSLEWQPSGDVSLTFDEFLLDAAFSNLLDNAVKYAADGSRVVARVEHVGRSVILSVKDEGRGIPAGSKKLIYELGQRASSNRLRRDDGLGLGLALAKQVAEAHEGTLTHTCWPPCPGPRTDDQRYTVTFKMQLSDR